MVLIKCENTKIMGKKDKECGILDKRTLPFPVFARCPKRTYRNTFSFHTNRKRKKWEIKERTLEGEKEEIMAPNNNRCKWSSIFMLLLSLSLAVSVAVATDKAPLVEDGTLSLTFVFYFLFGICVMVLFYIVYGFPKNDLFN